jgi:hypothetical protein
MVSMVGPPGGLSMRRLPSNAASRRSTPASPDPAWAVAPPTPSSPTPM